MCAIILIMDPSFFVFVLVLKAYHASDRSLLANKRELQKKINFANSANGVQFFPRLFLTVLSNLRINKLCAGPS